MGLLRYLLASLVLYSHLGHGVLGGINPGVSAVVVFYMLAGSVVAGLWQKWHALPDGLPRFYRDRLWRILPQYLLVCAAAALLWAAGAQSPFLARQPGPLQWLAQITVIPLAYYMYMGGDGFVLVPPAWSLGVELQFYVLAPALVLLPRRRLIPVALASLAVFAAAQMRWLDADHFGYRLLPGVLFLFLAGAALRRRTMAIPLALLWLGMALYLALIWGQPPVPYRRDVALGFVLGLPVLALLQRRRAPRAALTPRRPSPALAAARWLDRTLASASYGVFLWHFPVLWALALGGLPLRQGGSAELALVWAGSTALALAAHHAVELPLWRRQRPLAHVAAQPPVHKSLV